jgi:phosphopantothenoylcysteine decarboxylase/phosphopantothenate--cysteine ligase
MPLAGRELILGVTGSIAAYKAALLLRELTRAGARVTVVTTAHADQFVGPLTWRTLSGRPVLRDLFDPASDEAVEHVALAERAEAIVVAPATANLLAKAAHGIADDFLTTLLLAARCPVVIAPAMDGGMWHHAAVAANVATLRARGVTVVDPESGALASGLSGQGRLPEPATILEALERALTQHRDLAGERIPSRRARRASPSIRCATSRIGRRERWAIASRRAPAIAAPRSCSSRGPPRSRRPRT